MKNWYIENIKDSNVDLKTFSAQITSEELNSINYFKERYNISNSREILLDSVACLMLVNKMIEAAKEYGHEFGNMDEYQQLEDIILTGLQDSRTLGQQKHYND